MKRGLLGSFRARLIALLAGAILISEIIAVAIIVGDRGFTEAFAFDSRVVGQTVTAYGVAAEQSTTSGFQPLERMSSSEQLFAIQLELPQLPDYWFKQDARLQQSLREGLDAAGYTASEAIAGAIAGPPPIPVLISFQSQTAATMKDIPAAPIIQAHPILGVPVDAASAPDERFDRVGRLPAGAPLEAAYFLGVKLPDRGWLISVARRPPPIWPLVGRASLAALIIAVVLIIAAAIPGPIVRPINRLTAAMSRFGRGENPAPLTSEGSPDIRDAIAAFNTMSSNVTRTMIAQRQMLAAVGHDLRTPLTALRLKVEAISDPAIKNRMVEIIDEMQILTRDVLALVRQAMPEEESRSIELHALIDSLCQDLADVGFDVELAASPAVLWQGRGNALRRALRNLIENACNYGKRARVTLRRNGQTAIIEIDDEGPGVPDDRLDDILQPFVRLEESRNRGTGGAGLGLPIAQTIIASSGGRLTLANIRPRGLRVTVELPLSAPPSSPGLRAQLSKPAPADTV